MFYGTFCAIMQGYYNTERREVVAVNWGMFMIREITVWGIVERITLALILGGMIGMERGIKNQPAGFRTYMLVSLGASLVMMTNQYICTAFGSGDPSRLGAQVISGIGFLGAGTIMVTRDQRVRGLTTAAGLWSSACIGLAIGIGFYEGAIAAGIAILLVMTVFQKLDIVLHNRSKYLRLYLHFVSLDALNAFMEFCKEEDIKVIDMQTSKGKGEEKGMIVAVFAIKCPHGGRHVEIIKQFTNIEGIKHVEQL